MGFERGFSEVAEGGYKVQSFIMEERGEKRGIISDKLSASITRVSYGLLCYIMYSTNGPIFQGRYAKSSTRTTLISRLKKNKRKNHKSPPPQGKGSRCLYHSRTRIRISFCVCILSLSRSQPLPIVLSQRAGKPLAHDPCKSLGTRQILSYHQTNCAFSSE